MYVEYFFDIMKYSLIIGVTILLFIRTMNDVTNSIHNSKLTKREICIMYDDEFKINNNSEICKMFKLLGYYNIVHNNNKLKHSKNLIETMILNLDNGSENYDEICKLVVGCSDIKNNDYELKRSIYLSKHLIDKNTNAFYYSLNDDELKKIVKIKNLDSISTDGRTFYV
jgi:hypothetical protein